MLLTNSDIVELTDFRRALHRKPELPGEEAETAKAVAAFIAPTRPDKVITGLGGHGVAAIFAGTEPGPTVLIRSEIDGLPIQEISGNPWRSEVPGKAHLCGHEGHSTILCGVARSLSRRRPKRGRVVLMFQPAEENGAGAAAVIADAKFAEIRPDYSFSLHNMPGFPLGYASLAEGPMACASRGLRIRLSGKTSHASLPEDGVSPMAALARLMPALTALGAVRPLDLDFRLVTITHSRMGEAAFGVAPGDAELWATLRTLRDDRMASLCADAEGLVRDAAAASGLAVEMDYQDIFYHCDNDPDAVAIFRQAFDHEAIPHGVGKPMRPSEDFGRFGDVSKSAMFLFGSGEASPQLHNPDFDFPDALIEPGARIFMRVVQNLLGS
jgi:amidohydrolase